MLDEDALESGCSSGAHIVRQVRARRHEASQPRAVFAEPSGDARLVRDVELVIERERGLSVAPMQIEGDVVHHLGEVHARLHVHRDAPKRGEHVAHALVEPCAVAAGLDHGHRCGIRRQNERLLGWRALGHARSDADRERRAGVEPPAGTDDGTARSRRHMKEPQNGPHAEHRHFPNRHPFTHILYGM